MVLDGDTLQHRRFTDFPTLLRKGDVLVLNETRVIAARVFATRPPADRRVEILFLRPAQGARHDPTATKWLALVKPARRIQIGARLSFADLGSATVVGTRVDGVREILLDLTVPFEEFLSRAGHTPLPPYIKRAPPDAETSYQTVFARIPGSVAAPTASLHFTPELLETIAERGVSVAKIVLDGGLGTFRPISSETLDDHQMHAEAYSIDERAAGIITAARKEGRRVIAAGTTVLRALEGCVAEHGQLRVGDGETNIFITPGYRFTVVDALLTNFHLPKSTLFVLVCAFAGRSAIFFAYQEAIRNEYRFFSFGDAMFITHPEH